MLLSFDNNSGDLSHCEVYKKVYIIILITLFIPILGL